MSNFVINKLHNIFIVLLYFTCFYTTPSVSCIFTYEWTVNIYSAIQNATIDVHVKSADDDLGHHNVTSALGWRFHFCDSLFDNTLFAGDFTSGSKFVHFNVFDIEIAKIMDGGSPIANTMVYWLMKEDGYYLSKEFKPFINDPGWVLRGHW